MESARLCESWIFRAFKRLFPGVPAGWSTAQPVCPFHEWSAKPELIEALLALSQNRSSDSVFRTEDLCWVLSGLLNAAGCAVLAVDAVTEEAQILSAAGSWAGDTLDRVLEDEGVSWGFSFDRGMTYARRVAGHTELVQPLVNGPAQATCIAVPLRSRGERIGGMIVSYAAEGDLCESSLEPIRLLAGHVALLVADERARMRARERADRICRLTSDVERMSILLRRFGPSNDKTQSM